MSAAAGRAWPPLATAVAAGLVIAFVLGTGAAEETTRTVADVRTITVPDTALAG